MLVFTRADLLTQSTCLPRISASTMHRQWGNVTVVTPRSDWLSSFVRVRQNYGDDNDVLKMKGMLTSRRCTKRTVRLLLFQPEDIVSEVSSLRNKRIKGAISRPRMRYPMHWRKPTSAIRFRLKTDHK